MKKILVIMLSLLLAINLVACTGNNEEQASNENLNNSANELADANSINQVETNEENNVKEELTLMSLEEALEVLGLEEAPKTLAAASLSASRLAYKLGLPLVAIPDTIAKEIAELSSLPTLGTAHTPNYEQIVAVNADLVLFEYMFKDSINDVITEQNIPAYFINCNLYDNVLKQVEVLGVAFGKEEEAKAIINDFNTRKEAAIKLSEGKDKPKVMILFGTPQSYMLGSEITFVGDLANMLGAENVTTLMGLDSSSTSNGFIPMSEESAVAANPDYILCLGHGSEEMQKIFEESFINNPIWAGTNAIKNNNIVYLDSKLFSTNGGIHAIESLEELAKTLYQ